MKVTKKNAASTGHKQGCLIPRELENHEEIMKNDSDRKKKHRMTTENVNSLQEENENISTLS